MYFQQFYLGCLAHASYLIGSDGEAAVVDPQRDVEIYLEEARRQGLQIRHVIETHLHADFVSGHRELAARTGAKIYFGWKAQVKFEHVPVRDGDEIRMGPTLLRFLETPGHTPESISVLLLHADKPDDPEAVLTGDTLFIGDVGRPDLVGAVASAEEMAGQLYDSLHGKLLRLPDHVKVYPAHGAGSMCGRNISNERSSTIGAERRFNYALRALSRDDFIRMMTADLPERPAYFSRDAELNREGPMLLEQLPAPPALGPPEVDWLRRQGAVVLDTRTSIAFGTGHIPGALHIGLGGQFASWAGTLIKADDPIVLVADNEESVREARTRLARVGMENVAGYLAGGILEWDRAGLELTTTEQIAVEELAHRLAEPGPPQVLDVRRPAEYQEGHVPGALHVPLNHLAEHTGTLERNRPVAVICASGFRSSIATSILERLGCARAINVVGGTSAWRNAGLPVKTGASSG
jgi:glyoxylase-like metal-dependent hydrolase (beta-lactamase superfamily II)/rhodanese-related sulfurtransferase